MANLNSEADDGDFVSAQTSGDNLHLLLKVADFDTANSKTAYLRMGAVGSTVAGQYNALYIPAGATNAYAVNANVSAAFSNDGTGEDLACQVLSFIDDERDRGNSNDLANNPFATNAVSWRREQSSKLHTLGGWRDHSDGNRITTTRGDKVEVIAGNYKLLVLGREQWTTTEGDPDGVGLHHESSGGITYHYDEVPGQIIDVRWVSDPYSGTWKVLERCEKGDFIARYHGVLKEWVRGGDIVERVGTQQAYDTAYSTNGGSDNFSSDADFDIPSNVAHSSSSAWPGLNALPAVRERTFAASDVERVFAKNIYDYDGSEQRPVNAFESLVWANTVEETDGSSSQKIGTAEVRTYATTMNETLDFKDYQLNMTGDSKETWYGDYMEVFTGMALSHKYWLFLDLRIGASLLEVNLAAKLTQLNVAARVSTVEAALRKVAMVASPSITGLSTAKVWKAWPTVDKKVVTGIKIEKTVLTFMP